MSDSVHFVPSPPRSAGEIAERLGRGGPALVALSGGVDSGAVALLAHRALGPRALAVTLTGPAVTAREVDRATRVAAVIGIRHSTIEVDPLAVDEYRANPPNRCYFCRVTETQALRGFGAIHAVAQYLDGLHLDDLGDVRPGIRAMEEAGFVHPFVEAGWRKSDIRQFAQMSGLPNWDEPSDACLASRVRHGQTISRPLLDQVASTEEWFHRHGFRRVRVRVDGERARVEVDPEEVRRLLSEPFAGSAREAVRSYGFADVVLDPTGYRPPLGA